MLGQAPFHRQVHNRLIVEHQRAGGHDTMLVGLLQLQAMDIRIDELTPEQRKYLSSWDEGT